MNGFFFGVGLFLKAGEVIIYGNAPSYQGEELIFYRDYNPVLQNNIQVFTAKVDSTGHFHVTFNIDKTHKLFSYLGIYQAYLFVIPGYQYEIHLPEKVEKSNTEKPDPHFEEKEYHINVVQSVHLETQTPVPSTLELNNVIANFNSAYDVYYDIYARRAIYQNIKIHEVDSVISVMETKFDRIDDTFFNQYKTYKYAKLKYTALKYNENKIIKEYFPGHVLYHVPPYITLFNSIFYRYFLDHSDCAGHSADILHIINEDTSYSKLSTCLTVHPVLAKNEPLKEMVILKNLYDGFYNQRFSNQCLFRLLDSLYNNTSIDLHKNMAEEIKNEVKAMIIGHEAPGLTLPDKDSHLIDLKDFRGQYVYLNFCSIQSYECQLHFTLFDDLLDAFDKDLEIISIIDASSFESMKLYLENTSNEGVFLYMGEDKSALKKYNVKAYPSYFLIGPSGKISMSPADPPDKDFSDKFLNMLKKQ
jgi:peroxiredoxin